ncbi:uncharacterized protein K441DRAFT_671096, partial [Cenococcum geophilum 1.58]
MYDFELSNHGNLPPTTPFLLYGITLYAQSNHIHLAGGRPVMSLSSTRLHATLPDSLDLPNARYFFRLPLHIFWLGDTVGDLGWGPRTRHLVYPAVPLGWKVRSYRNGSCCKQGDYKRRVYVYRAGRAGTHTAIHGNLQTHGSMVRTADRAR